jgi:hypothetical protein
MGKRKIARIAGFVGALCATGALVGAGVQATGAYFTSSEGGNISAQSGTLTITNTSNTNLSFAGLMPGTPATKDVTYRINVSSGTVDVWLVFKPDDTNYQGFGFFTGGPHTPGTITTANPNGGGLGRYGYFSVWESHGGTAFTSGNLSYASFATSNNQYPEPVGQSTCTVNASNGRGGDGTQSTGSTDYPPYCGVPSKIRLASNVGSGDSGTVKFTLGINGPLWSGQNLPVANVDYSLVATQHGQTP